VREKEARREREKELRKQQRLDVVVVLKSVCACVST